MVLAGAGRRERAFTPWFTFIALLGPVLARAGACREAMRGVQAWSVSLMCAVPDDGTSGIVRLAHVCLWRVCARFTSDSANGWGAISAKLGRGAHAR
jgi:hypothetical protein